MTNTPIDFSAEADAFYKSTDMPDGIRAALAEFGRRIASMMTAALPGSAPSPTAPRAESTPVADPVGAFRAFCSGNTAPRGEGGEDRSRIKELHNNEWVSIRRSGDYVILEWEYDGHKAELVREHIEGPFSHAVNIDIRKHDMAKRHAPLNFPADRSALIERAVNADDGACSTGAPTPPSDRCEVCGGTGTVLGLTSDLAVRHDPCPACTKETPCDSGSGSASGVASSDCGSAAAGQGTVGASSVGQSSSGTSASSVPAPVSDAAPDPATVAGEGPYVPFLAFTEWHILDGNKHSVAYGRSRDDAFYLADKMNHAHRTALAVREAEAVRLRRFATECAERDCAYPNAPCLDVHISKLRHGMCLGCEARRALKEARDALKGDAR
jgi:hypothetical protein